MLSLPFNTDPMNSKEDKLDRALQKKADQQAAKSYRKEADKREAASKKATAISLPNGTTFMTATLNPIQLKVIIYILKELQPYIKEQLPYISEFSKNKILENVNSLTAIQGDLFREIKGNYYCNLPKKVFVRGKHYQEFRDDIDTLSSMKVIFKKRNPLTKKIELYKTTLFSTYEPASDNSKSRVVTIEMTKTVLERLCNISVALTGDVQWDVDYYNNVLWEVVLRCKKRYTGLLYLFLCAWRDKGGWKINTEELKKRLGIDVDQYTRSIDFKRFVLMPARDELKALQLDFWFEAAIENEYTVFKIITPRILEANDQVKAHIIMLLKTCRLTDQQIKELHPIITPPKNHEKIKQIIQECTNKFFEREGTNKPINDLAAYLFASLNTWAGNKAKVKKSLARQSPA